ncbi:MAG: prolyl oligopeptidase family serine peptidase [Candidatus Accumulibacter delftensis]
MSATAERRLLGEVPVLIVRPAGATAPLPTVLWLHGLGADKELHRSDLQRFAAAGLLAIGVDAVGHGQRRLPDFEQQFAQPPAQRERLFNTLVAQTVAELPGLLDALVDGGLSDPQRLAVAGVSMGGCITYGAVSRDRRFRAAVALLGSPAGLFAAGADAVAARFYPTALLSITAENDCVVPRAAACALHQQLASYYAEQPERLAYRVIAGAPHFMNVADWIRTIGDARAWLARFVV